MSREVRVFYINEKPFGEELQIRIEENDSLEILRVGDEVVYCDGRDDKNLNKIYTICAISLFTKLIYKNRVKSGFKIKIRAYNTPDSWKRSIVITFSKNFPLTKFRRKADDERKVA
jgi:hypothetical protein